MITIIKGNPGSGKTTQLKELCKNNCFYFTHEMFRDQLYTHINKKYFLINELLNDYIFYIIYQNKMHYYYNTFIEFINDVSEFFDFLLNTPIWLEDIHTSNQIFLDFIKEYNKIYSKLQKHRILDKYHYIKTINITQGCFLNDYERIAIDDADLLYLKEFQKILSLPDITISITNPEIIKYIDKDRIENIISLSKKPQNTKVETKDVENKYIFIKEYINDPSKAIIINKKDRIILEKYINENSNTEVINLLKYVIHKRLHNKKSNLHLKESKVPKIYIHFKRINSILKLEDDTIYNFLNEYENLNFEIIHNTYTSPHLLTNRFFDKIFIDISYRNTNKIKEFNNKIFPYDFFSTSSLLYEFEDKYDIKEFLKSKANTIVFFKESPIKKQESFLAHDVIDLEEKNNEVLSYSQISLYETCPYRYKLKYIYGIKEEVKPYFVFGNVIHSILESIIKKEIPIKEIEQRFREMLENYKHILKDSYEFYLKRGIKILKRFIEREKEEFRDAITLGVEYPVKSNIENKKFIGIIDRIVKRKNEIYLIDYKTSQPFNEKHTIESAKKQLSLYSYLLKEKFNTEKGYIWLLSQDKIIEIKLDKEKIEEEINRIKDIIKKIKEGHFPAKPSPQTCRGCSYKIICKYWRYHDS